MMSPPIKWVIRFFPHQRIEGANLRLRQDYALLSLYPDEIADNHQVLGLYQMVTQGVVDQSDSIGFHPAVGIGGFDVQPCAV